MRLRFLAAVVCVLVLAGCGGNGAKDQPQAIPAETTATTATTTTVAPTTTTNGLGVTQTYYENDRFLDRIQVSDSLGIGGLAMASNHELLESIAQATERLQTLIPASEQSIPDLRKVATLLDELIDAYEYAAS